MRFARLSRLSSCPLAMCLALVSCAEMPDSLLEDELLLDGDGDAGLIIDVGENTVVASDQAVETVAQVLNGEQGELFYRWEYALLDNATATSGSAGFSPSKATCRPSASVPCAAVKMRPLPEAS